MDMACARELHRGLLDHLDPRNIGPSQAGDDHLKRLAHSYLENATAKLPLSGDEKSALKKGILDEVFAYGPITPFLSDPDVTEIMVNGAQAVYIEKGGRILPAGTVFSSDESLRASIDRIIARVNRRIDESSPFADARLPDGSRVNAIIPPVSLSGPCLTIRRFREMPYTMEELVRGGSLPQEASDYLREAVVKRMNIIVSGGTGTGKTTFLNALSGFIPDGERIVTIEDAAEIRLQKPHVVRLEARPANTEGVGAVTIRDLFRNSLRMRPDRILIGECRGGEALDMLQAMNTGHDGSMTTGHANSPRDMLRRMETMVLLSGVEIPLRAIREQVASAIDIVVHLGRSPDGRRQVASVTEVVGIGEQQVLLQELFRPDRTRSACGGSILVPTGIPSKFRGIQAGRMS